VYSLPVDTVDVVVNFVLCTLNTTNYDNPPLTQLSLKVEHSEYETAGTKTNFVMK